MTFCDDVCVFHDRTSRTQLEWVKHMERSIITKESRRVKFNPAQLTPPIFGTLDWGIPPMKSYIFSLAILGVSLKKNKLDICDACFRAKQIRSQFFNSESKADDLFDSLPCDI